MESIASNVRPPRHTHTDTPHSNLLSECKQLQRQDEQNKKQLVNDIIAKIRDRAVSDPDVRGRFYNACAVLTATIASKSYSFNEKMVDNLFKEVGLEFTDQEIKILIGLAYRTTGSGFGDGMKGLIKKLTEGTEDANRFSKRVNLQDLQQTITNTRLSGKSFGKTDGIEGCYFHILTTMEASTIIDLQPQIDSLIQDINAKIDDLIDSGNISEKDKETLQELDVTELSIAAISAKLCDIVRNEMHLTDIALHNIVKTNSSLINKISSIQTKIAELYRLKSKQYDIHSSVIGLYINAVWARSISVLLTENNENSWELQKILSLHKKLYEGDNPVHTHLRVIELLTSLKLMLQSKLIKQDFLQSEYAEIQNILTEIRQVIEFVEKETPHDLRDVNRAYYEKIRSTMEGKKGTEKIESILSTSPTITTYLNFIKLCYILAKAINDNNNIVCMHGVKELINQFVPEVADMLIAHADTIVSLCVRGKTSNTSYCPGKLKKMLQEVAKTLDSRQKTQDSSSESPERVTCKSFIDNYFPDDSRTQYLGDITQKDMDEAYKTLSGTFNKKLVQ